MTATANDPEVADVPAESRFVFRGDHDLAELVYEVDGDRLILVHTGVPESLGGRGVGSRLVRASIARAAHDGLTIVPWCPFARGWLREHPDAAQGVRVDFKTPPPAA